MADYIYLLENRLTAPQQRALGMVRSIARNQDVTVFLVGGAVRDMTGGGPIRDLDVTVQGNALSLRDALEAAGAEIFGQHEPSQRLFLRFFGGVRVEVSSAMAATFPTPGKPEYKPASLIESLRSRDFTANAMAVSLNDGSYGLLMDPLNGVADIENRELRLVSNYGFIEDPSRLVRAARLRARLGWQLEERTAQRYETAKEEGYISALSPWHRGYELEEILHEEDPVRALRALEGEGWLGAITSTLTASKANASALNDVAERQGQLMMQGLIAQSAAINFPLVTAKLSQGELADLKALFVREGFLREIETIESRTRDFANQLGSKDMAVPSAVWRMLHAAEPNLVLSLAFSSKSPALQAKLKTFLNDSPGARQRIPYAVMQEMRITPDLPVYDELVDKLFFELMDNKLSTTEEIKAFLEPYSPPAPPPPLNLRRAKAKKEARPSRAKAKKAASVDEMPLSVAAEEEEAGVATGLMELGTLTGPNRGAEPTPREPLPGKEAPEPQQVRARKEGEANTPAEGKTPKRPGVKSTRSETVVIADAPKVNAGTKVVPVAKVVPTAKVSAPLQKVSSKPSARDEAPAAKPPAIPEAPTKAVAVAVEKKAPVKAPVTKPAPADVPKAKQPEAGKGQTALKGSVAAKPSADPVKPAEKKQPIVVTPAKKAVPAAKSAPVKAANKSAVKAAPAKAAAKAKAPEKVTKKK